MQLLNLKGTLMRGNQPLFYFQITDNICHIVEYYTYDEYLFPYGTSSKFGPRANENLVEFFLDRVTPSTRQGLWQELKDSGYERYDASRIILKQHGRAISDNFWISNNRYYAR